MAASSPATPPPLLVHRSTSLMQQAQHEAHESAAEYLTQWQRLCQRKQAIHYHSARFYYLENSWLNWPVAALQGLAGSVTIVTFCISDDSSPQALTIYLVAGIITVILSVLIGLRSVMDVPGRLANHRTAHAKLTAIINELEGHSQEVHQSTHALIIYVIKAYEDTTLADLSIPWWWLIWKRLATAEDKIAQRPNAPIVLPEVGGV